MEMIDEDEDLLSPPLSPLSVTDNLSQLAIKSFPLPDHAWTYLESVKKKFHLSEAPEDKHKVWQINELISAHFIKGLRNILAEQAKQILETNEAASATTNSSESEHSTTSTSTRATYDTPLMSDDIEAAGILTNMQRAPTRRLVTPPTTTITDRFTPVIPSEFTDYESEPYESDSDEEFCFAR
jgi:hypothetical protein